MKLKADLSALPRGLRLGLLLPVAAACVAACGGGGGGGSSNPLALLAAASNTSPAPTPTPTPAQPENPCPETGPYACKSGETEPLYTFQWALNYVKSWFADNADAGAYGGGTDLNVEPVHRQGIKGQGVNVLVIDSGVDLAHEDLQSNADYSMSWNFETGAQDPNPLLTGEQSAHGTNVAGIIAAAQNGKGVMGIAPQAKVGGAAIITRNGDIGTLQNWMDAYGGAPWSAKAHVINGSYGGDQYAQTYAPANLPGLAGIRALKSKRDGKGIVFIKAAGNEFDDDGGSTYCGPLYGAYNCINPANDPGALEPNAILTAALNAKAQASSYSSAGSVVWITGLGGEYGSGGRYGEVSGRTPGDITAGATGDGPAIFSTDISGCSAGNSQSDKPSRTAFIRGVSERVAGTKDNPNCDYDYLNGTSSAAPTIAGVVALMLSANPDLSWRDVRDILRLSARVIDQGYEKRVRNDISALASQPYNALFDLTTNSFTTAQGDRSHIAAGSTRVPVELGWTRNGAGNLHSNWYGFGVPDAEKAVALAQLYKREPARSRSAVQVLPGFNTVKTVQGFSYQKVSLLGSFDATSKTVDALQLRLTGRNICLGSVGIAVESPSGTVSLLKMPLDHFHSQQLSEFKQYGLGSYAFYGEDAKGTWKIYALASNPRLDSTTWNRDKTCDAAPTDGLVSTNAQLTIEARVVAQ